MLYLHMRWRRWSILLISLLAPPVAQSSTTSGSVHAVRSYIGTNRTLLAVGYDGPVGMPTTLVHGAFPKDFAFGAATSSFQIEGAWLEDGKGMSTWDALGHMPGYIANGDNGDVADDHYHRYKEDVDLMAQHGIRHYRLSINWPRVIPNGVGEVNDKGLAFYSDLVDYLLAQGITPYVTLWHSETPLALATYPRSSNPLLSDDFPEIFAKYAEVIFAVLGDRVKWWFTLNEPWCAAVLNGVPGDRDPYTIAHNLLNAHAAAVHVYRTKYQKIQKGRIGIVLNSAHFFARDPSSTIDVSAAQRATDFSLGWFADPIYGHGDYPAAMKETVGDRLPRFTAEQSRALRGSADFFGLNYYMTFLTRPGGWLQRDPPSYFKDMNVTQYADPAWPTTHTGWPVVPEGLEALLLYIHDTYPGFPIMVTENGIALPEDDTTAAVNDHRRQAFLHDHIESVGMALKQGVSVIGYFVWSILDNLEWASGFQMKFGMVRVERPSLERVVKGSLLWYKQVMDYAHSLGTRDHSRTGG